MAEAEEWAAGIPGPAYVMDDQSAIRVDAGVVAGRDGTDMVFVLAVDKTGQALESEVEAALDRLAADLAACRCGSG